MSIYKVFSESPRVLLLATLGFLFALVAVALFMHYAMGLPLLYAVLFGAIYGGGGSSVAVLSLVTRVRMSDRCETVLSLESVIDDVLCTVGSLIIIGIITRFMSLGSITGAVVAFVMLIILNYLDVDMVGLTPHIQYVIYTMVGAIFIYVVHRDNIQRLVTGKERKIGEKSKTENTSGTEQIPANLESAGYSIKRNIESKN